MTFDFSRSQLLLNPRMPGDARSSIEQAWRELVVERFVGASSEPVVGIATSGSSGDPRGRLIVLAQSALLASAASVNDWFASDAKDVWMKTLPSFHVGGLGIVLRAGLSGAAVVESALERWDAGAFLSELALARATLLSLVPTQLYDLVALGARAPDTLRAVILGGGRLEAGLRARALALGWPVYASYGLTECCSQVATERLRDARTARAGTGATADDGCQLFPLSHVELRVVERRIELRSRALLLAQVVFSVTGATLEEHGAGDWFRTEDHGQLERDGSLTVLGRAGDFVKIGGEGVVLARLEDRLEHVKRELGLALDAAVLAAEDPRLGAMIVLLTSADAAQAQALAAKFNEGVLPFERIRQTHRLDRLPRSALGKLQKAAALEAVGLRAIAHL